MCKGIHFKNLKRLYKTPFVEENNPLRNIVIVMKSG